MATNPAKAAEKTTTPQATWPDFAAGLYGKLAGGDRRVTYEFDDFNLYIPAKLGEQTNHFHWKMNGAISISSDEKQDSHDNTNE